MLHICEFCQDYHSCVLEKRTQGKWREHCRSYQARPDTETLTLAEAQRIIDSIAQPTPPAQIVHRVDIDMPMVFSTETFPLLSGAPRNLYLDFVHCDFDDPGQVRGFYEKGGVAASLVLGASMIPPEECQSPLWPSGFEHTREFEIIHLDMQDIQQELRGLVERYTHKPESFGRKRLVTREEVVGRGATLQKVHEPVAALWTLYREPDLFAIDIEILNAWLAAMDFRISLDDKERGHHVKPHLAVPTGTNQSLAFFYAQFIQDILRKQGLKHCPYCGEYFYPRRQDQRTCGAQKCRSAHHRRAAQ